MAHLYIVSSVLIFIVLVSKFFTFWNVTSHLRNDDVDDDEYSLNSQNACGCVAEDGGAENKGVKQKGGKAEKPSKNRGSPPETGSVGGSQGMIEKQSSSGTNRGITKSGQ